MHVGNLTAPFVSALRTPWIETIVRVGAIEDTLRLLHPMLSLTQVRARVVRIIDETVDTKTFVLQPNALWQGTRTGAAGQFVQVELEIAGRRHVRVYSLSSRPASRLISITVKLHAQGVVSSHLHNCVRVGNVMTISQPDGDFALPTSLPAKILLLSAGSGITPLMSMLRDLQAKKYQGDLVFLHVCKDSKNLIFKNALQEAAQTYPELSLFIHFSDDSGRFTPGKLHLAVPDLAQRSTWMCGPTGFMEMVHNHWQESRLPGPLYREHFAAQPLLNASAPGAPAQVRFAGSNVSFTAVGTGSLLEQAEKNGLRPKHGCRMGICRSCQCNKRSGSVENLQTGELSSSPNELIRLCISVARSDVSLDL
jgi:ferredoxin-NADP reductase